VVPARYSWVPAERAPGPVFNVSQLYAILVDCIREGKPANPDFSLGVRRHRMLDVIVNASETGQRQAL
jgi:hypothetical protein